jgi:hypothetical protein
MAFPKRFSIVIDPVVELERFAFLADWKTIIDSLLRQEP